MPRIRSLVLLTALLSLTLPLTGCGPVLSTYLIVNAQADLDGAQAAEAEKYAVYEYTAATEYLHKAREEQGYSDFGPSVDFAYKAQELAKAAIDRALEEKKRIAELPGADWQAPVETAPTGSQPSVIIKKKDEPAVKVVPVPAEQPAKQP